MEPIDILENIKTSQIFVLDYVKQHDKCFHNNILLTQGITENYKKVKSKLPYHINLIDELRANENAHSRILVKLLKCKIESKYPLLENFFNYLSSKYEFEFNFKIVKPTITSEKHRIDALIVDEEYAVIIENKIHYAIDQDNQIENYISRIAQLEKNKEIFIIYLTGDGGVPNDYSLSITHKEKLISKKRYVEISYSSDIINWIEECRQTFNFKDNEVYLDSALSQYLDHLKGMFNLRIEQKKMDEKLINSLSTQLNLGEDIEKNVEIVRQRIKESELTLKYLQKLLLDLRIKAWLKNLKEAFSIDEENVFNTLYDGKIHYGVKLNVKDYGQCSIFVEINSDKGLTYLCISCLHIGNDKLNPKITDYFNSNFIDRYDWTKDHKLYYGYSKASSKERGFQLLKEQIRKILSNIDSVIN